ncbi:MAG: type IV pilus modification protein PilV [Thiobacillaceae bacterium]|nr:type IV pilus modification protein PilV [Thiobacillaceae bacterium]
MATDYATFNRQCGLGLIEILVTLVVLSLGILGLAGLMGVALKNSHSALLRAQAAQYAQDMADRMRANRAAAVSSGRPYNMNLTSASATMTGTTLADRDKADWLRQLRGLPDAAAAIAVTSDAGDATITVRWDETAFGNVVTDPNCPEPRIAGRVCFVLTTRI